MCLTECNRSAIRIVLAKLVIVCSFLSFPWESTAGTANGFILDHGPHKDIKTFWTVPFNVASYRRLSDRQLISFSGSLPYGGSLAISSAIKMVAPNIPIIIEFDSGGGNIWSFVDIFTQLRAKCPSCQIIANIPRGALCASACILAFLRADIKIASPEAKFGFHAATTDGKKCDGGDCDLNEAGINRDFLKRLKREGVFRRLEMRYFSGEEMFQNSVIDGLADGESHEIEFSEFDKKLHAPTKPPVVKRLLDLFSSRAACSALLR
jgi:hypothetical protein